MSLNAPLEKGGRNAAFFFFLFLFAVAVLGFGGSLQYPLAVLRAGGFGAALFFLWRSRGEAVPVSPYFLLVAGFALLALGHAFSSTYFWVSFQHALNIALAAIFLAWAVRLFRGDPGRMWDVTLATVAALALAEVGVALYQRFLEGDLRPHGTFDNPNFFSEFLAAAAVLWLSRLYDSREGRGILRWETAAVLIFLAAALSLSASRGVLVALVPAVGFLLFARVGVRKGGLALAAAGLPVLALLGWKSVARFSTPDIYNYGRWIMWKSALRTFVEHPFGVGLGGYKYFWYATQSPVEGAFRRYAKFAHTAHSEYLEVLSGLGGVGFVLFLAVLVVPFFLAARAWKTMPESNRRVAAAATSCLVLTGAHAAFDFNFHEFGIILLGATMLGALLSCVPQGASPVVTLPRWFRLAGAAACAAFLAATVSTAAGAYSFDRGERLLKAGDLSGAERAFRLAALADPFRAVYPDALSAVHYRKYLRDRPTAAEVRAIPALLYETLQWEDRARELNPREVQYTVRLSGLFLELFRLRKESSDAMMAYRLAGSALRVNPYGVEILWHRADVLEAVGRRDEAARDLETAVAVEPNFCRGYARLAGLAAAGSEAATRFAAMARECRTKAAGLPLEDYEKWLVESPEGR